MDGRSRRALFCGAAPHLTIRVAGRDRSPRPPLGLYLADGSPIPFYLAERHVSGGGDRMPVSFAVDDQADSTPTVSVRYDEGEDAPHTLRRRGSGSGDGIPLPWTWQSAHAWLRTEAFSDAALARLQARGPAAGESAPDANDAGAETSRDVASDPVWQANHALEYPETPPGSARPPPASPTPHGAACACCP